jgi:hypothetical protein
MTENIQSGGDNLNPTPHRKCHLWSLDNAYVLFGRSLSAVTCNTCTVPNLASKLHHTNFWDFKNFYLQSGTCIVSNLVSSPCCFECDRLVGVCVCVFLFFIWWGSILWYSQSDDHPQEDLVKFWLLEKLWIF